MLDLRLPIGLFFLVVGLILVASGLLAHDTTRVGIPVDLYWGIFLLVFGALMTVFGLKGDPSFDEPSEGAAGDPASPTHTAIQERGH